MQCYSGKNKVMVMSRNMKLLLDKETPNSKVIIPDSAEFESITSNVEAQYRPLISQLGYLYDYQKSNNYK